MKELTGFEDIFEEFFKIKRKEENRMEIIGVDIYLPKQDLESFFIGENGVTGIGRGKNGDVIVYLGNEASAYSNIPHVFKCKNTEVVE